MLRPGTFALTALLALLTALGPIAVDMYLPSLPAIAQGLDATAADAQLTISAYLAGFAIGQIVYGPLSDRWGRKPVLMGSLLLFSLATLGCVVAPSIGALIGLRVLQAIGGSGAIVIARSIVRDLYEGPRAGRELSLMGAIMGIAPIVGPPIGGILQVAFGWRASFVVMLGCGVVALATVGVLLPETLRRRTTEPLSISGILRGYGVLLADRGFAAHLGIVTLSFAGLFAWISASSFVLQHVYRLAAFEFGVAFSVGSIGYLVGTALAAHVVTRYGLSRVIGAGSLALAAGGVLMMAGVALDLPWQIALVLPTAIYLAGLGMAMPQAIAGALTPFPDRAGAASSLVGLVQQSGAAVLGAAIGHMLGASAWPLAAAMGITGCLTLALTLASRRIRTAGVHITHR